MGLHGRGSIVVVPLLCGHGASRRSVPVSSHPLIGHLPRQVAYEVPSSSTWPFQCSRECRGSLSVAQSVGRTPRMMLLAPCRPIVGQRQWKGARLRPRVTAVSPAIAANLVTTAAVTSVAFILERTSAGAAVGGALIAFTLRALVAETIPYLRVQDGASGGPVGALLPLALVLTVLASQQVNPSNAEDMDDGQGSGQRGAQLTLVVLCAFGLGAVGSLAGGIIAFGCRRAFGISTSEAARVAGCIVATFIGGSINFAATARAVQLSPNSLGGLAAADIILMGAYFSILTLLHRSCGKQSKMSHASNTRNNGERSVGTALSETPRDETVGDVGSEIGDPAWRMWRDAARSALAVAAIFVISWPLQQGMRAVPGSDTLALTVGAWLASRFLQKHSLLTAGMAAISQQVAGWLLLAFIASIGAEATVRDLLTNCLGLAAFAAVALCIHGVVLLASVQLLNKFISPLFRGRRSKAWRIGLDEAIVASNANVGGPATAATFAGVTLKRPDLVLPATIAGITGYGIATTIGVVLARVLR